MVKKITNLFPGTLFIEDTGIPLEGYGTYEIPPQDYLYWHASEDIITAIEEGYVSISDAYGTFTNNRQALAWIKDGVARDIVFDHENTFFPTKSSVQDAIEYSKLNTFQKDGYEISDGYIINFDRNVNVSNDGYKVTVDSVVQTEDDGYVVTDAYAINFGQNIFATNDGNGHVTVDVPLTNTALGNVWMMNFIDDATVINKWLSFSGNGIITSLTHGTIMYASRLIAISFDNELVNRSCDVEIYKNGIEIGNLVFTWQLRNIRRAWKTNIYPTSDISFNQGDEVACYLRDGGGRSPRRVVVQTLWHIQEVSSGEEYINI